MNKFKIYGNIAYNKGIYNETLIAQYFVDKQWNIVEKRYRCSEGEIDLIVQKDNWLLFVEVKARKTIEDAIYAITAKQKKRLIAAANYYLTMNNTKNAEFIRFDLLAISETNQIEHIEDITSL